MNGDKDKKYNIIHTQRIMPRNKTGGRNNRKRANKHAQGDDRTKITVRLAKDDAEMYARVVKMNGNGRADVRCADGVIRLLEIRKKFRGRNKRDNMIAMDTMILVGERDWEVRNPSKKEKVDLLYVYSAGQHETLLKEETARVLLVGKDGIGDENEGFEITNTATWRQKVEEEGATVNTAENQKIQAPAEKVVGMNPMDDIDFDWDDI